MNEIERILKLLEEGKINAEEAYRLIEAIKEKKKERTAPKEEAFNFLDIGKVVTDAVKTAFSVVPHAVMVGFVHKDLDESLELHDSEKLEIKFIAGDFQIRTVDQPLLKIEGHGNYKYENGTIVLSGSLDVKLPKVKNLIIKANSGDIDGKIEGDEITLELKTGDADVEVKANKLNASVKMGDLDLEFARSPEYGEVHCEMGDLAIRLPVDYEGTVEAKINMGSLDMRKSGYRKDGEKYVFGAGEKSRLLVFCRMGDVEIK